MARASSSNGAERLTVRSPKGGAPITPGNPGNSGGKKGRSGRKPGEFKAWAKEILDDPKTFHAVRAAARSPRLPGFASIVKILASYSEGLPAQTIRIEGDPDIARAFDVAKQVMRERLGLEVARGLIIEIEHRIKAEL